MLENRRSLSVAAIAILGIMLGGAIGALLLPKWQIEKPYYAVYLLTGEIYVGKLSFFPRMAMTDTYLLQVVRDPKDPTQTNFQLTPLSTSLWSPSKIYINSKQVIFYGKVGPDSSVMRTIRGVK